MKVADYKLYCSFVYPYYVDRIGNTIPKPKNLKFDLGDIVYIKPEKAIGVVIGVIDNEGKELRTDMSGMVCFQDLRLATKKDLMRKNVRITPALQKEFVKILADREAKVKPAATFSFHLGNVQITTSNINELREYVEEIQEKKKKGEDYCKHIADFCFDVEQTYQTYHGLDADDWSMVHEGAPEN